MIDISNFGAHSEDFATWVIPYRREKPSVEWSWNSDDIVAVFTFGSGVWSFRNFGRGLSRSRVCCLLDTRDWIYIVIEQDPVHLNRFARCGNQTIWRAQLGYLTWLFWAHHRWAFDLRPSHEHLLSDRYRVIWAILRLGSNPVSLSHSCCIGWPLLVSSLGSSSRLEVCIDVWFHGTMGYTTFCNFSQFCCPNINPVTVILSGRLWLCLEWLLLLCPLLLTHNGSIFRHLADYIVKRDKILKFVILGTWK